MAGAPTSFPYWAPDGHHILFWRCEDDCGYGPFLFTVRADGSHQHRLLNTNQGFQQPSVISPNGELVAFENVHQSCDDEYCWSNIATAPRGPYPSQDVTHNSIKHPFRFATQPSWQPLPGPAG